MNLILSPLCVNLHVTLTCLSATMQQGVFIVRVSVMVCHSVMMGQISWLPNVTCVRIPSCVRCGGVGQDVCLDKRFMCDGKIQCGDGSDELVERCACNHPTLFTCTRLGVEVCLSIENQCNGIWDCDDRSDELALQCDGCQDPQLF